MQEKEQKFVQDTKKLIDSLKAITESSGLGGDGNEYKIMIQVFLYKFLNDKFIYDTQQITGITKGGKTQDSVLSDMTDDKYERLLMRLPAGSIRLKKDHYISYLYNHSNDNDFYKLFDNTLLDIAAYNEDVFSVKTASNNKVNIFEGISKFIIDESQKDKFCKAVINRLVDFSFEQMFDCKYDFFSVIFEYLISDYYKDDGGAYAEYYTPKAVAEILSAILVEGEPKKVDCYDPAAGSGTLLMSLAHAIGENKCVIYSQDISQKSTNMLRLNLILNNLVLSLPNVIHGNTLLYPSHRTKDSTLRHFDYIVSNPPFKCDFSDYREDLASKNNASRFFAGIPKVPPKEKEKMAIYLPFIQHIIYLLKDNGKAAIVVPTGFITAQNGIEYKIRKYLIDNKMLSGVVSMPSNIFATTGTNVSVIFLDKQNKNGKAILIDASKLGKKIKEGKKQRTVLSEEEKQKIIKTFKNKELIEDFSVMPSYNEIAGKNYSLSAGQYFDIKIDYVDITEAQFEDKMSTYKKDLKQFFEESKSLEQEILKQLDNLTFNPMPEEK